MRTTVILLVLAASAFADVFNGEKVRVGRGTCTCTFSLVADGTKLSPKSKAKCDKKCNGAATKVSLEGESGVFTFDMKVKKGKVALSKGSVVIATTTKTTEQTTQTTEQTGDSTTGDSTTGNLTTGDSTTGDATTGASTTGGEGPTRPLSGSEPEPEPTGSGSGQVPVPMGSGPVTEATGSGSDPGPRPTGSGSGPRPTGSGSGPPTSVTGPGSGQGPKDGMQCSCRCDCPDGSGQCDCNCNCPMQSMAMVCAQGFTRVCPMMEEGCPPETEKVCPRGMEDKKPKGQSRMDGGSSGCQCVPDFLMSLMKEVDVEADVKELANRAAPDIFKNEKIKMGKTTCTCTLTLLVDGTKLSKKSKAVCDKKCSGAAKNVVLTGRSGIVYTLDVVSKKGKAKVKGTIKIATPTTPKPPKPTVPKPPKPTRPAGTSKPPGSGSGEQEKGPSCSCVATKTGGSAEPTGPGSETGSGTGSEPGSEPGSGPEPGSGSDTGSEPEPSGSGPTVAPPTGTTLPNPGSAAAELTLSLDQTWSQEPAGYTRTALVTVPATTAGQKVPVVFHLHGNGGQGNTIFVGSWLGDDCIIVAPNGYERSWNVYTEKSKADDISFIIDLIAKIGAEIPAADMNNVNIIGTSNGAALTYRMLIETGADRPFKRAFPMVSSLISPQYHDDQFWASPTLSEAGVTNVYDTAIVPVFADGFEYAHFHGTEDGALKYEGQSPGPGFLGGADVIAAQKTDYLWAKAMGFTGAQLADSAGVSIGSTDKPVEEYLYLDGRVRHYKLVGEGHGTGPGHTKVQEIVKAMVLG